MPGLDTWKKAASFHLGVICKNITLTPILFIPIVNDALSSILIKQSQENEVKSNTAITEALKASKELFLIKLYFVGMALLWSIVPIYGIFKSLRYRQYWAMASNVLIFENKRGDEGINRCKELIDFNSNGMATRVLVTIPTLLITLGLISWVVAGSINDKYYVFGYSVWAAAAIIVTIPWSGAVNTYLYLDIK